MPHHIARRAGSLLPAFWVAALCGVTALSVASAQAQDARAATGEPYRIGVFLENFQERCFSIGFGQAVRRFVDLEVERINRTDGVAGRPIQPVYIEEREFREIKSLSITENEERTAALDSKLLSDIRSAADGELLAYVGPTISRVNRHLFTKHYEDLRALDAPFIVRTSNASELASFQNVFVARPNDLERAEPIAEFITSLGAERVFYAIRQGRDRGPNAKPGRRELLLERIRTLLGAESDAGFHMIETVPARDWEKRDLIPESVDAFVAKVRAAQPDLVFISVGYAKRAAEVVEKLRLAGVNAPLFFDARLEAVQRRMETTYPSPIYSATRDGESLPGIADSALDAVISRGDPSNWIFSGRRNAAFAAKSPDNCQSAAESRALDFIGVDAPRNVSRITVGATAADMVRLIVSAAASKGSDAPIEDRRAAIRDALGSRYILGRGVFEGAYSQWAFYPDRVAAARPPYFLKLLPGTRNVILAPQQFLRERYRDGVGRGALRSIPTLYIDVDLIRAYNVDENDRTFFADFYLTMQAPEGDFFDPSVADIKNIEFSNAYLDVKGAKGRQIAIQTVSEGESGNIAFPAGIKVYKISGRFFFTPTLRRYPFDKQQFSIDIQPRQIGKPFLIQPPAPGLRDGRVDSDNWNLRKQFVSMKSAAVPIIDTLRSEPNVAPFFQASFGFEMERETKDYFLRVLVPLGFILIVAYLSIFISRDHFEAIITIQVTALLSSVALYLSVPQIESESTTVSDWIFLFCYLTISLMIAISICRINKWVARRTWLTDLLRAAHILLMAPVILAFTIYQIADVTDFVEWIGIVEPPILDAALAASR